LTDSADSWKAMAMPIENSKLVLLFRQSEVAVSTILYCGGVSLSRFLLIQCCLSDLQEVSASQKIAGNNKFELQTRELGLPNEAIFLHLSKFGFGLIKFGPVLSKFSLLKVDPGRQGTAFSLGLGKISFLKVDPGRQDTDFSLGLSKFSIGVSKFSIGVSKFSLGVSKFSLGVSKFSLLKVDPGRQGTDFSI
jgi:hypothetical protein